MKIPFASTILLFTAAATAFVSVTRGKGEKLDSEDENGDENCQTKLPNGRHTMRIYPPGTALFIDGKCLCDGIDETIYEYVPPPPTGDNNNYNSNDNRYSEPSSRHDTDRHRPGADRTIVGNYGALVFSGDVRVLNLLNVNNDGGKYLCCNCPSPSRRTNKNDSGTVMAALLANSRSSTMKFPGSVSNAADKIGSHVAGRTTPIAKSMEKLTIGEPNVSDIGGPKVGQALTEIADDSADLSVSTSMPRENDDHRPTTVGGHTAPPLAYSGAASTAGDTELDPGWADVWDSPRDDGESSGVDIDRGFSTDTDSTAGRFAKHTAATGGPETATAITVVTSAENATSNGVHSSNDGVVDLWDGRVTRSPSNRSLIESFTVGPTERPAAEILAVAGPKNTVANTPEKTGPCCRCRGRTAVVHVENDIKTFVLKCHGRRRRCRHEQKPTASSDAGRKPVSRKGRKVNIG